MITVRKARSEEVPRMMEIAAHAATAARWTEEAYKEFFASDSAASSSQRVILVIQEDDNVAGFLAAREVARNREWEIENVAVIGSARRRGLGSRLLGEFLNLVRERGGSEVYLEVRESNLAARRLYEKWAFVETGKRKAYYHDPPEDARVLRLRC
jgi:ribosomal-protein-alanine N-acetyltransferase